MIFASRKWLKRLLQWVRKSERRPQHLLLGERGEEAAAVYLEKVAGYRIVAQNISLPIGRNLRGAQVRGEIDIVAYDGEILSFIEVKTRTSQDVAMAERAVDLRKQRVLARSAAFYRRWMRLRREPYRFDVLTVLAAPGGYTIELRKGYFSDKYRRPFKS